MAPADGKFRVFADYHTHTRYSHGTGSVRDNVRAAVSMGLSEVGITDHGPAMLWIGTKRSRWGALLQDIEECQREFPQIKVLAGIEANVVSLDGRLDTPPEIDARLDIRLAGIHLQVLPPTLDDTLRLMVNNLTLARWTRAGSRRARVDNTKALVEAVYRNRIDLITHPGLKVNIDTAELARACVRKGTALEINASHTRSGPDYVRVAARQGAKFVLSSDAHDPRDVGRVERAAAIAEKAGLVPEQIANVALDGYRRRPASGGGRPPEPIEDTVIAE
ncbi:MAG: PHP domain-containing protein [Firmicutes bacterium]|nr:PHP domain-containing protein [Bacillota bacterium]